MDNSEIKGIFFCNFGHCCGHYCVLCKFWFLENALIIILVISFFFIVVVKEGYCYVVAHHKQAVFVSERLLIQTCPEREHMPWLALCKQQSLLRWCDKNTATNSVSVNRKCALSNKTYQQSLHFLHTICC